MLEKPTIRVGARALIFQDGCVLLVKFDDETGVHYNYPGGGVEVGESVSEAVAREVYEETCVRVRVEKLVHVYEYVPAQWDSIYGNLQKLSLLFICSLLSGEIPKLPEKPDQNQIGVEWVPVEELAGRVVYPKIADVVKAVYHQTDSFPVMLKDRI